MVVSDFKILKEHVKFQKVRKLSLNAKRLNMWSQKWIRITYLPKVRILGRSPKTEFESAICYIARIYGLSYMQAFPFVVNFGYRPFVRVGHIKPGHWVRIKWMVEKKKLVEKALKKYNILSLRNVVKQGNVQSSRFWRGLPIHGQNARTNGQTARRINVIRIPANMRLKRSSSFLSVNNYSTARNKAASSGSEEKNKAKK